LVSIIEVGVSSFAPPSISVLFFLYEGELIKYLEWSCWTATRCGRRF